jgi:hypothetical protein
MPVEAELELTIAFSDELGQVISSRFIEKIKAYSGGLFQRGIANSNRLFLTFAGTEEMTPFVLSLIKKASEMGKEYKIGVRDYYLPSYEISFDSDHIGKIKIPFAEAVICNGKSCKVVFKDVEKDFLRRGSVKRIMFLIYSKTREKTWKVIYKNDLPTKGLLNPTEELEKRRLAVKGLAKNEYFYLPQGAKELSRIKSAAIAALSKYSLEEFFPLSHVSFSLLESEDILELAPPEIFESVFGEVENTNESFESYFITGSIKSISARSKGVIFDEIPFNLYKALERRNITSPLYLYTQKNKKILITFFEKEENYLNAVQTLTERMKKLLEGLALNYRIIARKANGDLLRFEGYLPYNKTWITLSEAMFSEDAYTKPFKIEGKSGQLNISLENIFLAEIAQGTINPKAEETTAEKEELPRKVAEL